MNFFKLLIFSFVLISTLQSFAQEASPPPPTTYSLPSLKGFPAFALLWKQEIPDLIKDFSIENAVEAQLPEGFVNEHGSLLSLGLEAGGGSKELRIWMRILRDIYPVLENASPSPSFRRTLKLMETPLKNPLQEEGVGVGEFLPIEISKTATPWEKELCEAIIPWIHSAQLLAGRTTRAENRRKDPLTLRCKLRHYAELKSTHHFLQIAEWPLPYKDLTSGETLFRTPQDLYSADSLQRLQKMK